MEIENKHSIPKLYFIYFIFVHFKTSHFKYRGPRQLFLFSDVHHLIMVGTINLKSRQLLPGNKRKTIFYLDGYKKE